MYQTTVKANEGSKGSGFFGKSYGLGISATIDAEHLLEQEIRHVNECFVNWLRKRGKHCSDLAFVFVAPAESQEQIRELVRNILDQPLDMDGVISRLDIALRFLDSETGALTAFSIKWQRPAQ